MIEIFHEFRFEAAHFLPRVPAGHPCGRMHGHSYAVVVYLTGEPDPVLGWVRDFGDVQQAWAPLFAQLDHRVLNEVEGLENPTAELIAAWLLERLAAAIAEVSAVTVRESPVTGATVRRGRGTTSGPATR